MTIDVTKGRYPHVGWVDLEGDGILTEIAIMANNPGGLSFIKLNALDVIDKQRLLRVITNRNTHLYELWDLMSNITLGNGMNALEYFHQYVKVLTPSGKVITPSEGRRGAANNKDLIGLRKMQKDQEKSQQFGNDENFATIFQQAVQQAIQQQALQQTSQQAGNQQQLNEEADYTAPVLRTREVQDPPPVQKSSTTKRRRGRPVGSTKKK